MYEYISYCSCSLLCNESENVAIVNCVGYKTGLFTDGMGQFLAQFEALRMQNDNPIFTSGNCGCICVHLL